MSVLIPDLKIYSYLQEGLRLAAYNTVVDAMYSQTIRHHCMNKDTEAEAERLTRAWLQMNEETYENRYPDERDGTSLNDFYKYEAPRGFDVFQCLKYAHCVRYNIEQEYMNVTEAKQADLRLLDAWIRDIERGIVVSDMRYERAKWCDTV